MKSKSTKRRQDATPSDPSQIDWRKKLEEIVNEAVGLKSKLDSSRNAEKPSKSVEQQLEEALDKAGLGLSPVRDIGAEANDGSDVYESSETPPSIPQRRGVEPESLIGQQATAPTSRLEQYAPLRRTFEADNSQLRRGAPSTRNMYTDEYSPLRSDHFSMPGSVGALNRHRYLPPLPPYPHRSKTNDLGAPLTDRPLHGYGPHQATDWGVQNARPIGFSTPKEQNDVSLTPWDGPPGLTSSTTGQMRSPWGPSPIADEQERSEAFKHVMRGLGETARQVGKTVSGALFGTAHAAERANGLESETSQPQDRNIQQVTSDPQTGVRISSYGASVPAVTHVDPSSVIHSLPKPWSPQGGGKPANEPKVTLSPGHALPTGHWVDASGRLNTEGVGQPVYFQLQEWNGVTGQPANILFEDLSGADSLLSGQDPAGIGPLTLSDGGQEGVAPNPLLHLVGQSSGNGSQASGAKDWYRTGGNWRTDARTAWKKLANTSNKPGYAHLRDTGGLQYTKERGYNLLEFGIEDLGRFDDILREATANWPKPRTNQERRKYNARKRSIKNIAKRVRQQMVFGANGDPIRAGQIFIEQWGKIDPRADVDIDPEGNIILLPAGKDGPAFYYDRPGWSPQDEVSLVYDFAYYGVIGLAAGAAAPGFLSGMAVGALADIAASRARTQVGDALGAETTVPFTRDLIAAAYGTGAQLGLTGVQIAGAKVLMPVLRRGFDHTTGELKNWARAYLGDDPGFDVKTAAQIIDFNDRALAAGIPAEDALRMAEELGARRTNPSELRPDIFDHVVRTSVEDGVSLDVAFSKVFGSRSEPKIGLQAAESPGYAAPDLRHLISEAPSEKAIGEIIRSHPELDGVVNERFIEFLRRGLGDNPQYGLSEEDALEFAARLTRTGRPANKFTDDFYAEAKTSRRLNESWGDIFADFSPTPGDALSNRSWGFINRAGGDANNLTKDATDRYLRYLNDGLDDEAAFKRMVDETIAGRWHNIPPTDIADDAWREVLRSMTNEIDFDDAVDAVHMQVKARSGAAAKRTPGQVWKFNLQHKVRHELKNGLASRKWTFEQSQFDTDEKEIVRIFEELYPDGATPQEVARIMDLGFDNGPQAMRPNEISTAIRLERYLSKQNRVFDSQHQKVALQRYVQGKGPDWVDPNTQLTYDAVGGGIPDRFFNYNKVINAALDHLDGKTNLDVLVIDLHGLSRHNADQLRGFVNGLDEEKFKKTIVLE